MAEKLGARKNSRWKAVCTAPDICKTPVGPNTIPIPYIVIADLGQSDDTVANVRFTSDPCYVLDQSFVPHCTGDEPGTAKGIRSGTVAGKVEPTRGCRTVRATGKQVVRDLDPCTLNGGNCPGIHTTQPAPGSTIGAGCKPTTDTKPPVKPTPAEERGLVEKVGAWWKQTKTELGAAVRNPGEAAVGALKDTANTVPEVGEMMARGSALNQAAEIEQAAAMQRLFGLNRSADQLQASAEALRQVADKITFPKYELSTLAEAGGAKAAMIGPLAAGAVGLAKGIAKAGVKALAKSGSRALAGEVDDVARVVTKGPAVARELKAADAVGDAARTEQALAREGGQLAKTREAAAQGKKAPKGSGVRIEKPPMSLREQYLGRTPGKGSRTGKEVIERMREEGKIREGENGLEFLASDNKWYDLKYADMSHKTDAVRWWNDVGRNYGTRSPEVRGWMLDSKNYTLDHMHINRSLGGQIGQGYLPPIKP